MAKQIFNTRGMKIEDIKVVLRDKIERGKPYLLYKISRLQESLDYEESLLDKKEKEISYLEKFIARKEKSKNENNQMDI